MGLALFIFWLKTVSLRRGPAALAHELAAGFWAKIFGMTFAVGVVTGIPMEFQFGTNWAGFSNYAGGVIGQTLAMEGVFAFFAESVFLGAFLAGRRRIGDKLHWLAALMLFAGSWISGFFIIATNAWMQHPVAYSVHDGRAQLDSVGRRPACTRASCRRARIARSASPSTTRPPGITRCRPRFGGGCPACCWS